MGELVLENTRGRSRTALECVVMRGPRHRDSGNCLGVQNKGMQDRR